MRGGVLGQLSPSSPVRAAARRTAPRCRPQRFRLFNLAALETLRVLPFSPGEDALVVCNDWHTALLPVLLKDVFQPRGEFTTTKTALVIHNVAFQVWTRGRWRRPLTSPPPCDCKRLQLQLVADATCRCCNTVTVEQQGMLATGP